MKVLVFLFSLYLSTTSFAQVVRPISFTDTVYKMEKKENEMRIFFIRRSAVYYIPVGSKDLIQKLELSKKNKKRVVITADPLTQKIIEIKN